MSKKRVAKPTDSELEILNVLWEIEPCTVREVHDRLSKSRDVGYTTVLKLMQIMTDKRLVDRDESRRSHVYRAVVSQADTRDHLLADLADRAFGGSVTRLAMQALADGRLNAAELQAIQKLIRDHKESAK